MKKYDWILLAVILAAALCLFIWQRLYKAEGSVVVVSVDGRTEGSYSLSEDQTVTIEGCGGSCILVIKNNTASVESADCPDRLCVKQKGISRRGETIACLPNRILISVEGPVSGKYDAVAR